MRSANCMNRPELALFTTPKSARLLIFLLGAKKFALLNALNISQRNRSRALRFQGKVLGDHDVPGLSPGPGQVVMDLQTSWQHADARQHRSRLQLLRRNQEDDLVPQLLSDWNFASFADLDLHLRHAWPAVRRVHGFYRGPAPC